MRTASILLVLGFAVFASATAASAQEAASETGFSVPTAATFKDGYQPLGGEIGDLRLVFLPGRISEPKLQIFENGALLKASGYCTPDCRPKGKNPPDYCFIGVGCGGGGSSGGGGPAVLHKVDPLLIEIAGGEDLELRLIRDPATVQALAPTLGFSEIGAANE